MSEENILRLSYLLELLFLASVVFAILAVWMNWRAKRVKKLKDELARTSAMRRILDDHKPD